MSIRPFFAVILLLSTHFFSACSSRQTKDQPEKVISTEQFQCPMKCSDEVFTKPGTCPVCGMELEKIANS